MGQQSNKVIKRRRRKAYHARKNALARQGITRRTSRTAKSADAEGDVKKASKSKAPSAGAAKKTAKPAAKKVAKPAEETSHAAEAPEATASE